MPQGDIAFKFQGHMNLARGNGSNDEVGHCSVFFVTQEPVIVFSPQKKTVKS